MWFRPKNALCVKKSMDFKQQNQLFTLWKASESSDSQGDHTAITFFFGAMNSSQAMVNGCQNEGEMKPSIY